MSAPNIETIVSLVLLTLAVIPALYLANLSLNSIAIIQDNLTASNLAQEGLEVVRGIRDDNWFNNRPFDFGINLGLPERTPTQ